MSITKINPPGWPLGGEVTSAQFNAIDTKLITALDKTSAGDTLSGVVTVAAGGGLYMSGANTYIQAASATAQIVAAVSGAVIGATASGAYVEASTAGAKIRTRNGGRLEHGDNDYPNLASGHSGRSRVLAQLWGMHCVPLISTATGALGGQWTVNTTIGQPTTKQPMVNGYLQTEAVSTTAAQPYTYACPLVKLVNGATLSSVIVNFYPAAGHAAPPAGTDLPAIYVLRTQCTSGTLTQAHLKSTGSGLQYSTFSGTAGQWNSASGQSITYTPDQNNTIDTATYDYFIVFADECGANAIVGTQILSVLMTYTNILDMRSMP